ncbi:hypothetical protein, partial [Bacteroides heparinolyticus]|uniref:hypothetical protein n=1 Tax=Prevotella heparinolytica TaxID=28113 RepID=UPI0035A1D3A7
NQQKNAGCGGVPQELPYKHRHEERGVHGLRPLGPDIARPLSATAVAARDRRRRNDTADGDGHPAAHHPRGVPQVPVSGGDGEAGGW